MKLALTAIAILISLSSLAQQTMPLPDSIRLKEVIIEANKIFGSKFEARNRTGSSYYISPEEIKRFNYTDINRTLRAVPGVNVYEEDGFGLRPNISLRGTSPQRSAKITLMEDGVLIAPAPYSSPSAYYFPTIARMQSVEILKGSSQVQFGPYTTGGAINMISSEVPDDFKASLSTRYGSFQSGSVYAQLGDSRETYGYVVEYLNYNSNGFKNLDNDDNTGFDKNDLLAKFRINTKEGAALRQAFELKFQYSDESSNETYLGLSQADFDTNPYRRYAGSQNDLMTNDHLQFTGTHTLEFSDDFRITTVGYYNEFSRNWYKVDFITFNGERQSIANVLNNPLQFAGHLDLVRGDSNSDGDDFMNLRANNRKYYSAGVQTKLDYHWTGEHTFHDLEIGLRYHADEEDRFQWIDDYAIADGDLSLVNAGIPGTNANRISDARAFAAYTNYKIKFGEFTLMPGVRYEHIQLQRRDYGTSDIERTGANLAERTNQVNVLIPGLGFNYNFEGLSVFGGVHRGFSPPSNQPGEDPEQSVNYELGSRFSFGPFSGEVVGFFNDYSNLLGSDLAATGGTGSLDQFNAGEVNVRGVEVLLSHNLLARHESLSMPVMFSYTLTDTEFRNSFDSANGIWGEVNIGDEVPYISRHQFYTSIAIENEQFSLNLSGRYNGAFRTQAGSGNIPSNEKVAANFIIDAGGRYKLNKNLSLTANVINLLDETYATARVPAGLRPGHPFGVYAGFELNY